jgi:hypothetical protein
MACKPETIGRTVVDRQQQNKYCHADRQHSKRLGTHRRSVGTPAVKQCSAYLVNIWTGKRLTPSFTVDCFF